MQFCWCIILHRHTTHTHMPKREHLLDENICACLWHHQFLPTYHLVLSQNGATATDGALLRRLMGAAATKILISHKMLFCITATFSPSVNTGLSFDFTELINLMAVFRQNNQLAVFLVNVNSLHPCIHAYHTHIGSFAFYLYAGYATHCHQPPTESHLKCWLVGWS